jgi:hypothetical protein
MNVAIESENDEYYFKPPPLKPQEQAVRENQLGWGKFPSTKSFKPRKT